MTKSLAELRQQLIEGDQSFIETTFKDTYDYTVGYLKKNKFADDNEAHDLFVDGIMILRERLLKDNLPEIKNIKSYLVGICINLNKEVLSKKYHAESKEQQVRELFYNRGFEFNEEELEEQEALKKICIQAIETLGEKCQKLLNMFHFEGLNMAEIAKVMGFSSGNVAKTIKSRCFKKLVEVAKKLRKKDNDNK